MQQIRNKLLFILVLLMLGGCAMPPAITNPTPTQEFICEKFSYARLEQASPLYRDIDFLEVVSPVLPAETLVLLLANYSYGYWEVVTMYGERYQGYLPMYLLPKECQLVPIENY